MGEYRLIAGVLVMEMLVAPVIAGGCDPLEGYGWFTDEFQGTASSAWQSVAVGSTQQVAQQNGRLEFPGTSGSGDSAAGFVASGWQLSLDEDFLAHATINMTLPEPGINAGYGIGILLTADTSVPLSGDFTTGVFFYRGWEGDELIEGYEARYNGNVIDEDWDPSSTGQGVNYIGYDSSLDVVGMDDNSGFSDPWAFEGLSSLLGDRVTVTVLTIRAGTHPATSGDDLWIDSACIEFGSLTGDGVGACCAGMTCTETLEPACAEVVGTWQGEGSICADTECGESPTGACCVGTACQALNAEDCAAASGSYHGDGVSCDDTPCGGGEGCPEAWSEDCMGICFPNHVFDAWIADDSCDDGAYIPSWSGCDECPSDQAIWLNCDAWDCDGGDCTCEEPCVGDVTGSGDVDGMDLLILQKQWGSAEATVDLDGSGLVDVRDLLILLMHWGPCA